MRLLSCIITLANITGNGILSYICHVYNQDLNKLLSARTDQKPNSVLLTSNCSVCFAVIYDDKIISGCRRNGWEESKTMNEPFGVMCSRRPDYCNTHLCCCTANNCFDQLRKHFIRSIRRKGIDCDVYRQRWIGNDRQKGLNKTSKPKSEQIYRRSNCAACASRADEDGVEITCVEEEHIGTTCGTMSMFVGGALACSGNGDCCCQGVDCPEQLRNFYSGKQELLGPPSIVGLTRNRSFTRFSSNSLIIAIPLLLVVVSL